MSTRGQPTANLRASPEPHHLPCQLTICTDSAHSLFTEQTFFFPAPSSKMPVWRASYTLPLHLNHCHHWNVSWMLSWAPPLILERSGEPQPGWGWFQHVSLPELTSGCVPSLCLSINPVSSPTLTHVAGFMFMCGKQEPGLSLAGDFSEFSLASGTSAQILWRAEIIRQQCPHGPACAKVGSERDRVDGELAW